MSDQAPLSRRTPAAGRTAGAGAVCPGSAWPVSYADAYAFAWRFS